MKAGRGPLLSVTWSQHLSNQIPLRQPPQHFGFAPPCTVKPEYSQMKQISILVSGLLSALLSASTGDAQSDVLVLNATVVDVSAGRVAEDQMILIEDGTIAAGRRADLVLLVGNPLVNLATLRDQLAVIIRDRLLEPAVLDALEATLRASAQ